MLCSDRVGQVTKTYHDIKAVTHLLEEVRGRHKADEWDYRGLKLTASLTSVVCHPINHTYFWQRHQKDHLEMFGKMVKWIWLFICQIKKKMAYQCALSCKINVTCMYHFAERAGSRVSSTDRSVPPEAESRTDDTQWNTGWTAWNCKGRGTNKTWLPRYTPVHSHWNTWLMWISYSLLSSSDANLLHFSRSLNFVMSCRCETTSFSSTQALRRSRTLSHSHRKFTRIVFSMF